MKHTKTWRRTCLLGSMAVAAMYACDSSDEQKEEPRTFSPLPCPSNVTDETATALTLGQRTSVVLCAVDGGVTYVWKVADAPKAEQEYQLEVQTPAGVVTPPPFAAQLRTVAGPLGNTCGPTRDAGVCAVRIHQDAPALFADVFTPGPVPDQTQLTVLASLQRDVPTCTAGNIAYPQAIAVEGPVTGTVCPGQTWWWRKDGFAPMSTQRLHLTARLHSPFADGLTFLVSHGTLAGPQGATVQTCATSDGGADCTFQRPASATASFVSVEPEPGVYEEFDLTLDLLTF